MAAHSRSRPSSRKTPSCWSPRPVIAHGKPVTRPPPSAKQGRLSDRSPAAQPPTPPGAPGLAGDRDPTGDRLAISLMPAGGTHSRASPPGRKGQSEC
jgi:hypothetical protein